jgi:hypothetical protein
LSPTSESTVMASDLVSPCRNPTNNTRKKIKSLHSSSRQVRRKRARADPEQRRRHGGSGRGVEAPIPISGGEEEEARCAWAWAKGGSTKGGGGGWRSGTVEDGDRRIRDGRTLCFRARLRRPAILKSLGGFGWMARDAPCRVY